MSPTHADLVSRTEAAFAAGRLDQAQTLAQQALDAQPDSVEAMLILGMVTHAMNLPEKATPILKHVVELDPSCYHSRLLLSTISKAQGDLTTAIEWAQQAVRLDDNEPHGLYQLGACYLMAGQWEEAVQYLNRASRLNPASATIQDRLGVALHLLGRRSEAILAFKKSLDLDPRQIAVWGRLAATLMDEGSDDAAAACAHKMLEIDPVSAEANILLASALSADGYDAEAIKYGRRAIRFAPNDAVVFARFGSILQNVGDMVEASKQFQKSIELQPYQGAAYLAEFSIRKVVESDRTTMAKMEELVVDPSIPRDDVAALFSGLGKAYEDLSDYEAAMKNFNAANRLLREIRFGNEAFDMAGNERLYDFLIQTFNGTFIEKYRPMGSGDPLPIFVVGMIRTGTTLTEQILSSHPAVGGAGEQRFWLDSAKKALGPQGNIINVERMASLSSEYLTLLRTKCPGKQHVVDKLTANFLHLGFLHCAFPNARIIHMQRHPVDTSLSIWSTPNRSPTEWANTKEGIVFTSRQYQRIAEHWRKVLPPDRYLDVQYEELVSDQERVTRNMVEFCGLKWDEACLRPQDNKRSVSTPSVSQVRQPVYKTSINRWQKYEPYLEEFAELLK